MVMAVVDAGSSSSSSSSSYEVVICLEVVTTLFVVEILLFFFLGVTHLTVVTSGSVVVLWRCEPSTLLFFNFTPGKAYFTVLKSLLQN